MKLLPLCALALVFSACEKPAEPIPEPPRATPAPTPSSAARGPGAPAQAASAAAVSPTPKPGAWMYETRGSLEKRSTPPNPLGIRSTGGSAQGRPSRKKK